ncbi:chromatin modification- protein VID21, partial [Ascosphaera acerosa]
MACRTLKRLYQLQSANRWPLRQMRRAAEPKRQPAHWDVLLDHAKWMATDFKEERRWKIAVAKACAEWCRQYAEATPAERAALRVRVKCPARGARVTSPKPVQVALDAAEPSSQHTTSSPSEQAQTTTLTSTSLPTSASASSL